MRIRTSSRSSTLRWPFHYAAGNDAEFNEALGVRPLENAALESVETTIAILADAGFQVVRCEQAWPRTRYLDVGAVVLQLRAVPWQVPGFDVEEHLAQLRSIHHHIGQHGSFDVTSHRLLVVAHRGRGVSTAI